MQRVQCCMRSKEIIVSKDEFRCVKLLKRIIPRSWEITQYLQASISNLLNKILVSPPQTNSPDGRKDTCLPKAITQTGASDVISHKYDESCNRIGRSYKCLMLFLINAMEVSLNVMDALSFKPVWRACSPCGGLE